MAFDFDIGILGGGAAGLTVASGAARLGARTLLIDVNEEGKLGGDCLHFGCVPSKALIETARVWHALGRAPRFGLPAVPRPPVNFPDVAARVRSVIDEVQPHDSAERFRGLGVKVVFGRPAFTDERSVRVEGRTYTAGSWVVATGSSPFIPPIPGLGRTPHLTNRELFSLDGLPGSMICIGGGPVAVEMAQAFARLGSSVTVVEQGGQILAKEDADMAGAVREALEGEGVAFHLGASVLGVSDRGTHRELRIRGADGGEKTLRAACILVAAGRSPNLAGLGLEGIGVEFDGRGLALDGRLRSSHKHIYGAGDVTGAYQFTHAAGYEGAVVLANAVFRLPKKADYTLMPWCTYTDPELASIGMNEAGAKEAGIRYSVWTEEFGQNDRSLAGGEKRGLVKMLLDEGERPVGVQVFGPHAGELIGEWVAAMNGGVRLSTIASAVHPYPTLCEINKKAAGAPLSRKLFSDKVRKGLRLLFRLRGGLGGGARP